MRGGFGHRITAEREDYKLSRLNREILGLAWKYIRPNLGRLTLAFVAMLVVTGTTLAVPYLTKIAVDDYITPGALEATSNLNGLNRNNSHLTGLNLIFLVLLATQGLFWPASYWQAFLSEQVGRRSSMRSADPSANCSGDLAFYHRQKPDYHLPGHP